MHLPELELYHLSCYRLGEKKPNKKRPIKVVINWANGSDVASKTINDHKNVAASFKVKPYRTKLRQNVNTALHAKLDQLENANADYQAKDGFQIVSSDGSFSYSFETEKFELDEKQQPFVATKQFNKRRASGRKATSDADGGGAVGSGDGK